MTRGNEDETADVFSVVCRPSEGGRIREMMQRVGRRYPEECTTDAAKLLKLVELAQNEMARER